MTAHERDGAAPGASGTVGRRGLVAAAAAMVAGLAARHVADATPVAAATTDTSFTATGTSTNFDARGTADYGLDMTYGAFFFGVRAIGTNIGVSASGGATGVSAGGSTYSVIATASNNGGVGVGSTASGSGSYGVLGNTTAAGSVACSGQATGPGSYGVYGTSTTSHGVYGITAAPGASSVYGYATARGAAAISGVAGAGAYAGSFTGPVVVNGQFVAYGGGKSAALPHPDGSHRLVYCVESPEAWLEDFGEGKLVGGRAEVALDPDFAAVADTKRMHVFLTEKGGKHHHLNVSDQGAGGFTVEADGEIARLKGKQARDLDGAFSYRVVAKRKDIRGERLATFALPKTETAAPSVPKVSEPPKPPEPPKRPDGR